MAIEAPRDVLSLIITPQDIRSVPVPGIMNVVGTMTFRNPLVNMELLAMRLPGVSYNPHRFAAIIMRMPRPMALAFCSGDVVCPGARSITDARMAALRFVEYLLRSGEYVQMRSFTIENVVMTVRVEFEIELTSLVSNWSTHTEYQAGKFPGAVFKLPCNGGEVTFTVFVSGSVNITGLASVDYLRRAWYWFYREVLLHHKKGTIAGTTSSAAYRMATMRQRDTFAADCSNMVSAHVRRPEGPMARSVYSQYVSHTPRTARTHTVVRPIEHQAPQMLAGHSNMCPFIRVPLSQANMYWYSEYIAPRHDHATTGCAIREPAAIKEQLANAIGIHRLSRIHGDVAPLKGHTLDCPLVKVREADEKTTWTLERHRLEAGISGIAVDDFSLASTLDVHRRAGCFAADEIDWDSDDALDALARALISQLHVACKDFIQPISLEDATDYEAQFLLDAIRNHDSGIAFSL